LFVSEKYEHESRKLFTTLKKKEEEEKGNTANPVLLIST
jgi:hypothetical protein